MKQLLQTSGNAIITGYGSLALVIVVRKDGKGAKVYQLLASNSSSLENDVQSVALTQNTQSKFICAVCRQDKTMDIYNIHMDQDESESAHMKIAPIVTHKTNKRCSSLVFSTIQSDNNSENDLQILIAGDLVGDVTAYPTTPSTPDGTNRLLLGHTVSILTSINIVNGRIFSADRDEKIRVSTFPETFHTEGYLLGHEAYITDIAISMNGDLCVSVSGDYTMKLWDCVSFKEIQSIDLCTNLDDEDGFAGLPIKVTMNKEGNIAVIYDEEDVIDIFDKTLTKIQRIKLSATPLAISFDEHEHLIALLNGSTYCVSFEKTTENLFKIIDSNPFSEGIQKICSEVDGLSIPKSILEKDENGRNSLMKIVAEEKGGNQEMPWNRVERIEKQKERARRRKRRKLEEALAEQKAIAE
jgi:WD40 repeat protein/chorismate mutase